MLNLLELLVVTEKEHDPFKPYVVFSDQIDGGVPPNPLGRCSAMVIPSVEDSAAIIAMVKPFCKTKILSEVGYILDSCVSYNVYSSLQEKVEHFKLVAELIKATLAHPDFKPPKLKNDDDGITKNKHFYMSFISPDISTFVKDCIVNNLDITEVYEATNTIVHSCFKETGFNEKYLPSLEVTFSVVNDITLVLKYNLWDYTHLCIGSDVFCRVKNMNITEEHFKRYILSLNQMLERKYN